MPELYYVCALCQHTVSAPEWPARCEDCGSPGACLRGYRTLEAAEEASEQFEHVCLCSNVCIPEELRLGESCRLTIDMGEDDDG